MKIIVTLIFFFFAATSFGQVIKDSAAQKKDTLPTVFNYTKDFKTILEKTKDRTSDFYYFKLLSKFLNEDSTITKPETLALMIGYTEDAHFKPWEDMETEKEIFDMNDSADYQGSLDASKTYLETHPLSLRVLKERSFSYAQLKQKDSAKYFMDLVDKVMSAMIYSGKGKTPETPIFSLGLADGEYFIPNVGMTVANKNTDWNKHNEFVEIIDAMNDMGEHKYYYFVIQHAKEKIDDDMVNEGRVKKKKKSSKPSKKEKEKQAKEKEKEAADNPILSPAGN